MALGEAVTALVLAAVSALIATASPAPAGWTWPLDPEPRVVRHFDPPDRPWLSGHRGVDLASTVGALAHAPTNGRITFSGGIAGTGVIVVTMPDGLRSTFQPVSDGPPVGTVVSRGDPIGTVSATPGHCSPDTCLHWGVLRGDTYLDPLQYLGRAPIVLLPFT